MSRVIERIVDVDGHENGIGVRAEPHGLVITWFCGDRRTFNEDDLRQTIDDLELLADYPDVWLDGRDSHGQSFTARIADGQLRADTRPGDHASRVPWKDLKKTLRKMAA